MTDLSDLMPVAARAMDIARDIVLQRKPEIVTAKGDRDMVSDTDIAIERAVRDYLAKQTPHVGFLGEEEGLSPGDHQIMWALDPIDGTANFVQGIPLFSISLALIREEKPVLGIIDVPAMRGRYSAYLGNGARYGSESLRVRSAARLSQAIVTIGDYAVGDNAAARNKLRLAVTHQLAGQALRVRMLGSAAIDLAWLAHGRTNAAIIFGNKPWDTAAGVILVREAGGHVVDHNGTQHTFHSATTIAVPPPLQSQVLHLVQEA
jgi:myo-inositol-1(or 4)-monophosphatase